MKYPNKRHLALMPAMIAIFAGVFLDLMADPFLPPELDGHVIYYNSFRSGKPEIRKFKSSPGADPVKFASLSGNSFADMSAKNGNLELKTPELSFKNNLTVMYWFMFGNELKENAGGSFISNNGKGFISVFVRGGADGWSGLKDSAGVAQAWGLQGINGICNLFDRKFRINYPAKTWHHFAITSNGRKIQIFLDGKTVNMINLPRTLEETDNLNSLSIGGGWPVPFLVDELVILDISIGDSVAENCFLGGTALRERK